MPKRQKYKHILKEYQDIYAKEHYIMVCARGRMEGKLVGIASSSLKEAEKNAFDVLKIPQDYCRRVHIYKKIKEKTY